MKPRMQQVCFDTGKDNQQTSTSRMDGQDVLRHCWFLWRACFGTRHNSTSLETLFLLQMRNVRLLSRAATKRSKSVTLPGLLRGQLKRLFKLQTTSATAQKNACWQHRAVRRNWRQTWLHSRPPWTRCQQSSHAFRPSCHNQKSAAPRCQLRLVRMP